MFRFEYDKVVGYHPYRTHQPWDHGGVRLLHIDGVNGDQGAAAGTRRLIADTERQLLRDCEDEGIKAQADNHYGFTVVRNAERAGGLFQYYQLRFSDGSLYVWLMPGPPQDQDRRPSSVQEAEDMGLVATDDRCMCHLYTGGMLCRYCTARARPEPVYADPLRQADWDEPVGPLPEVRRVPRTSGSCPCSHCRAGGR